MRIAFTVLDGRLLYKQEYSTGSLDGLSSHFQLVQTQEHSAQKGTWRFLSKGVQEHSSNRCWEWQAEKLHYC